MTFKEWLFGPEDQTAQEILNEVEEDEKKKIKTYTPSENEDTEQKEEKS